MGDPSKAERVSRPSFAKQVVAPVAVASAVLIAAAVVATLITRNLDGSISGAAGVWIISLFSIIGHYRREKKRLIDVGAASTKEDDPDSDRAKGVSQT